VVFAWRKNSGAKGTGARDAGAAGGAGEGETNELIWEAKVNRDMCGGEDKAAATPQLGECVCWKTGVAK